MQSLGPWIPLDTCSTVGRDSEKIDRSHANPGFPCGRPCLPERKRKREHHDEHPECDTRICGESRAKISCTAKFEEARGGEDIRERSRGDTACDIKCNT